MWIAYICRTLLCCCLVASALGMEGIEPEGGDAVGRFARLYSGPCGDGVTCGFFNGSFHVSGSGNMANYSYDNKPPYYKDAGKIKEVVIEEGVTSIGDCAFFEMTQLITVTIGEDVRTIGNDAFYGSKITQVNIPESVVAIGDGAFESTPMISLTIPNSVVSIGTEAFHNCLSLANITLGKRVNSIGTHAFSSTKIQNVLIPDSVTSIGDYVFTDCLLLTGVVFGKGLKTIGNGAFKSCGNLTSITIPDSVTVIGDYCFNKCVNLTSVVIGDGLKTIGNSTFKECNNLRSFVVKEGNKHFASVDGVLFDFGKTKLIKYPSMLLGSSYTIPGSVKTIAINSFESCRSLKNVIISGSVVTIGDYAFAKSSLTSVTIGDGVKTIGEHAFESCVNLINVTIGNNVNRIGDYAFNLCRSLTDVVIPDSVVAVGVSVFSFCEKLKYAVIGDGLKTISDNMFSYCSSLESVVIGDSVSSIGGYSFSSCSSLKSIFFQGSESISESTVFESCNALVNICVSPAYNSTSFCSRNVTSTSAVCQQFQSMFSNCYKGTCKDGNVIREKRDNATEWEEQSDGCFEHQCNEEAGLIKWSICNSTSAMEHTCLEGQCNDDVSFSDDKWAVEMEIDKVKAVDFNVSKAIEDISTLAGVGKDEIMLGIVVDENGYVVKVIAYVGSEETANVISESVNGMDKEGKCKYQTICRTRSVVVKWIRSISDGHCVFVSRILLTAMLLLILY